jgi:hypothetical protein
MVGPRERFVRIDVVGVRGAPGGRRRVDARQDLVDLAEEAHAAQQTRAEVHVLAGDVALDLEHPAVDLAPAPSVHCADGVGEGQPGGNEPGTNELDGVEPCR